MRSKILSTVIILLWVWLPFSSGAAGSNFQIEDSDFRLQDSRGDSYLLSYGEDIQAVVLVAWPGPCPLTSNLLKSFAALEKNFLGKPVKFFWLNPWLPQSTQEVNHLINGQFNSPVLMDYSQTVSKSFHFEKAGDFVLLTKNPWKISKNGKWDAEGIQKVLEQILHISSHPLVAPRFEWSPCALVYEDYSSLSWNPHLAQIFYKNCVACHGLKASRLDLFSKDEDVFSWTAMSRLSLRLGLMPPEGLDNRDEQSNCAGTLGFRPQQSELRLIQNWLEQGAPHSKKTTHFIANLRKKNQQKSFDKNPKNSLSELIWESPVIEKSQSLSQETQILQVAGPMPEDLDIVSYELLPTEVGPHHVKLYFTPKPLSEYSRNLSLGPRGMIELSFRIHSFGSLVSIANGKVTNLPGYVVRVPKGSYVVFQVHLVTRPEKQKGRLRLRVRFASKNPSKLVAENFAFYNKPILIPPGEPHFVYEDEQKIDQDISIVQFLAHAHFRGVAFELILKTPDGVEKPLCRVPNLRSHGSLQKEFIRPAFVPKGSTLRIRYTYDNSKNNSVNPDPTAAVKWGMSESEEAASTRIYYLKGKVENFDSCLESAMGCPPDSATP